MGGTRSEIIPTPTTPAPSPSETSEQALQAQLKYNPQLYQQYANMYQQYMPQLAGTDIALQQQYAPQVKSLQEAMYPQQTQLTEVLAGQALQRFQNPYGYSNEEQAALDAIRGRAREQAQKNVRNRANLGGNLYSGNAITQEERMMNELEQAFVQEDINRKLQGSQQALQYATPILQMQYPQIQNPSMPDYTQSVVPDANNLYNAYYQSSQPNYMYQQGQPSPLWGLAGSVAGGVSGGWANNFFK